MAPRPWDETRASVCGPKRRDGQGGVSCPSAGLSREERLAPLAVHPAGVPILPGARGRTLRAGAGGTGSDDAGPWFPRRRPGCPRAWFRVPGGTCSCVSLLQLSVLHLRPLLSVRVTPRDLPCLQLPSSPRPGGCGLGAGAGAGCHAGLSAETSGAHTFPLTSLLRGGLSSARKPPASMATSPLGNCGDQHVINHRDEGCATTSPAWNRPGGLQGSRRTFAPVGGWRRGLWLTAVATWAPLSPGTARAPCVPGPVPQESPRRVCRG